MTDNHATSGAHANPPVGTMICSDKYQVVRQAGTGNFARVFECIKIGSKEAVAVKFLKKGYERDADFECDVLKGVNRCDAEDQQGIVKLVERCSWNGFTGIVFKLKGAPLRAQRLPLSDAACKRVVFDVAEALSFLHFTVRAVHTDLKPENILAELPSSSSARQREWAICDLGSASFYTNGKLDTDLITTRPYRAPEVVMNKGWSFPADAWSLGCILYELRTGKKLFDCHSDGDHISMMEQKLGPIPSHLRGTRMPLARSSSCPSLANGHSRTIAHEFSSSNDAMFLSVLLGLLEYDPTKRMRCDVVLRHEYFQSTKAPASTAVTKRIELSAADPPPTKVVVSSTRSVLGTQPCNVPLGPKAATPVVSPLMPSASAPFFHSASAPSSVRNSPENMRSLDAKGSRPAVGNKPLLSPAFPNAAQRISFL